MSTMTPYLVLLFTLLQLPSTRAFPGGVGGCAPNRAAVEGPHLGAPARQTGPIGNARLQMVLDDQFVLRSSTRVNFTIREDHTLTLRKIDDQGTSFRGFLFRLGPGDDATVDTTDALQRSTPNTTVVFEQCVSAQGVGGLGHTNPNLKEMVYGVLRMEEVATNMPLDVTVVIQNRNGVSEFYYQQFLLNAVTTNTGPATPTPPTTPSPSPTVVTPTPTPPTPTPAPATPAPVLPQRKNAPGAAKCGSLAAKNGRGGAAAKAKGCFRNSGGQRRRLKGM